MKILVITPPYRPVPPRGYGGAEMVCYWLVRELLKRKHEVSTCCVTGSAVANALEWDGQDMPMHAHIREKPYFEAIKPYLDFDWDIVHDHTHLKIPCIYCNEHGINYLNTCHLPEPPFTGNAVALSQAHKLTVSPTAEIIHLGVPVGDYTFAKKKSDYFLYLGYIAPHKRVHLAIKACKEADVDLFVAGPYDDFPDYFHDEVEPLLDHRRKYVGEAKGEEKLFLLTNAKAILLPINWAEPGSTVAFEALASGTPVIGWRMGALVDIINNDTIGHLVDTEQEFVEAIKNPPTDYVKCREYVKRFDIPSRVDLYERLYERVTKGETW